MITQPDSNRRPKIVIVYEDAYIIVADKPVGLLTVSTPKKEKFTLTCLLSAYPVHRLDRETSGLILFARTKKIQQILMDEFRRKRVRKRYIAFVQGRISRRAGLITKKVQDNPYEMPKDAVTKYRVLQLRNGFSVLEAEPVTGRTNQIRIHFKQIGHPLVGERRFAFARDFKLKFRRVALHSCDLEFQHPVTGKRMAFHSDLPSDMAEFLKIQNGGIKR
jgi:23S rRNA pseudouridine1911/1915/1917 synthase